MGQGHKMKGDGRASYFGLSKLFLYSTFLNLPIFKFPKISFSVNKNPELKIRHFRKAD